MARKKIADIYKKYDIEYKNGKILTPFGMWVNPLMPYGTNDKIGKAWTFSIYHGNEILKIEDFGNETQLVMKSANIREIVGSCPFHCDGCYCDHGNFQRFDSVKAGNMLKLILARNYLNWLERALNAQIEADNITQIRIHVAGDFFSKEYADMWKRIIVAHSMVKFWTYTKVDFALARFQNLLNVSIVPSKTPIGFNFGTCKQLLKMYKKLTAAGYNVHICACNTPFQVHCAECNTGCKAIGNGIDYVLFIKHSTKDYTAGKKDLSDYIEVLKIIAMQQENIPERFYTFAGSKVMKGI